MEIYKIVFTTMYNEDNVNEVLYGLIFLKHLSLYQ